jgi:cell fate regulator YaaT (PSP1 superfamily)
VLIMNHLHYLARFGLTGDIGRFTAEAPLVLSRGDRVVLRTPRGVELGQVVRPATDRHARYQPGAVAGELMRPVMPEDEETAEQMLGRARAMLQRGEELVGELRLPVELLDAEVLLDGEHASLLHVRWGSSGDLRDLVRQLSRDFELSITLSDIGGAPPQEEHHGCGSCGSDGGCGSCGSGGGSGGGGCKSGTCGSASREDVRAYFAELREQMLRRVPLL